MRTRGLHVAHLQNKTKNRNLVCSTAHSLPFGLLFGIVLVATTNAIHVDGIECGTINLYREAVLGGKTVLKDEWPFIAALYYSRSFEYFCGGTIISKKHVLTAAHCIQGKFKSVKLSSDEITVRLGAYNLTNRTEKDAVNVSVTQIYVHPNWKVNEEKYDADIAMLVLDGNLTFSNHIRPVCMPPADFFHDGINGTVVGWGRTENGTAEGIPRKIEVNALNDTYCYKTDEGIARYASERSFCGEGRGTPNDGDSGGGFFAVFGSGWVQFGTVSFVRPERTGNNLRVAMYTKLASLRDWIADKVRRSGGEVSVATTKADLNCIYGFTIKERVYGCWLYDLNVRQERFVVTNFTGSHTFGKDNDAVELISFKTGVMVSIPHNFGNLFRNLKFLALFVNVKHIFRSSLENLERLEGIRFLNSSITEFDENSLWDLSNLQSFELINSKVELLHAATFCRNHKLKSVKVRSNLLKSLPGNLFQNNSMLGYVYFDENLIETIDENIFRTNAELRQVSLNSNRLDHLHRLLFKNNPELQSVKLSNNLIKTIDEQFFENNWKIEEISLQVNQLTHIPANLFRNNSQLKMVDLRRNSIEVIDENVFEKNYLLDRIALAGNRLVEFPGHLFRHNSMLEFVACDENLLEAIDERTFQSNRQLRKVIFDINQVTFLPGKLFQNNSLLEYVSFKSNYLDAIDEEIFRTNANLQEVHLSSNWLTSIPENLFRYNPLLRIVDLSRNSFKTLDGNYFSRNPNIEKIILQRCSLETLPRTLFRSNLHLKYIDLRGNRLHSIKTDFTLYKQAYFIDLTANSCINAVFYDNKSTHHKFVDRTLSTNNVTELHNHIKDKCNYNIYEDIHESLFYD